MSDLLNLTFDGTHLNGNSDGTSRISVREDFEWPTAQPKREWAEKKIGQAQVPNPRRDNFELTIPLQIEGTEDQIAADAGTIAASLAEAESLAHIGGSALTAQLADASTATTLNVLAGELVQVKVDFKRLYGVATFDLKLYCEPWLLGPWATAKTGRKPAGVAAQEVQISGLSGDIPGPARITVTNQGSAAQQFAMLGLDGRGYASGNKLVLMPATFDYSTAPLNGTYTAGTNEVQTATKSGTISGGTFTLTYEGQTTSSLAYNAATATVQTALEALSTIGTGNITVGGTTLNSGNMTFTGAGDLANTDLSLIVLNSSLTGGGSAPITQTTQGVMGYVANTSLQSSFSDFMRTGDQTDTGSFQLWALVYTDASQNEARVRASISIGDTGTATINRSASVPATSAPVWINLGPVHAKKRISSGSYRWNATIGAMTVGTVGTDVRVLRLAKLPVDLGVGVVKTPQATARALVASDDFEQTAGAYTSKSMPMGGTVSGGGDTADFYVESWRVLSRSAVLDAANTGREFYVGSNVISSAAQITVSLGLFSAGYRGGAMVRRSASNKRLIGVVEYGAFFHAWPEWAVSAYKQNGGAFTLLSRSMAGSGSNVSVGIAATQGGVWSLSLNGGVIASGVDADLATGGALETGKVGGYDENTSASLSPRYYDSFRAWMTPPAGSTMWPARSLKWQPDGSLETEASGGTYFGYTAGQQRAGVPLLDPSGTNRLAIASANFNPDVAGSSAQNVPLDYTVEHRPAYAIGRH